MSQCESCGPSRTAGATPLSSEAQSFWYTSFCRRGAIIHRTAFINPGINTRTSPDKEQLPTLNRS